MKSNYKSWIIFGGLMIAVIVIASMIIGGMNGGRKRIETFSEVVTKFENNEIVEFNVQKDDTLVLKDVSGVEYYFKIRDLSLFVDQLGDTINKNYASGTLKRYNYEPYTTYPVWIQWIPLAVVFIGVIIMYRYTIKQMSNGGGIGKINSFGKAKLKMGTDEKRRVYFSDVAGADEEKEELREVVEYLKDVKNTQGSARKYRAAYCS